MTHEEKWAKHAELSAKAEALHAEWKKICDEINTLLMTRAPRKTKK